MLVINNIDIEYKFCTSIKQFVSLRFRNNLSVCFLSYPQSYLYVFLNNCRHVPVAKVLQIDLEAQMSEVAESLYFQRFSAFLFFAVVDGLPASRLASAFASSAGAVPKALCVRRFILYRFAYGDPVLIYNI